MCAIRDRSIVRSSVTPSAKYCCSGAEPRLAKGITTIDRRGAGDVAPDQSERQFPGATVARRTRATMTAAMMPPQNRFRARDVGESGVPPGQLGVPGPDGFQFS